MSSGNSYITNLWYVSTREDNGEVKVRLGFQANDSVGTAQLMYEQEDISDFDPSSGLMMYMSNNEGMFPDDYHYQIVEIYGGLTSEASGVMEITGDGTLELGYTYTIQAYDGGTPTVTMEFEPVLNTNPKAKNLASGTLASSISASTTNLLVYVGDGSATTIKAVWPDTPFYATLMPASPSAGVPNSLDSEIVKVTAVGNDQVGNTSLTVVRGQKGTTTKAFSEGDIVTNAVYAGDAVLLGENETSEAETPWINASDIIWSTIVDKIYPVGSIFMSATLSTASAVGNALGGTWIAWGAGKVPVGVDTSDTDFDTAEETGGEKTHTLTNGETPKRDFYIDHISYGDDNYGAITGVTAQRYAASGANRQQGQNAGSTSNAWRFTFGNDEAHNNLQPYITCYMYKRIS